MPSKNTNLRRGNEWLLVVVLALSIRVGYCAWTHRGPYAFSVQYREYIITAQRLLEHKAFLSPLMTDANRAEVSGLLPPMYTIWVAGVYGLFGIESRAAIIVLELANAIALSLACGLAFKIAHALAGQRAAWIAGLIAALNPALVGHTNYIWDTSFFALAVTLSVWFSICLRNHSFRPVSFFGFGIWLGVVALLNPALTPAYPLLVLFPLWRGSAISLRRLFGGIGASVLGWMIAIAPWTIRNYVQLGTVQYVRSGFMLEVWLGVTPEADHAGGDVYRNHFPLLNQEVARHVSDVGERKYLEECGDLARRAIAENPLRFAKLVLMRTVDHWFGTALTHAGPQQRVIPATRQRQLIMLVFSLEILLIFFAVMSRRLNRPETWWLIFVVVVFSLVYSITHVQVRFRVPIEPLIAVLVGISFAGQSQSTLRVDRS
jgi:4-amino-4-deoxy-L-arabinose transferase-like glycosyltransferase